MSVAVGKAQDWKQWEGEIAGSEFPLEELLGSGNSSAVFRTRIASRSAAIKLVPAAGPQAEELIAQWNRGRELDNPHFIKIIDVGTWENAGLSLAFVVTEYADENLATVLLERALTGDEVLEMLPSVASALAYLHSQGLVHGQLKPANIFAIDDTLKLSSDSISPANASGDPWGDMRAVAATVVETLTQRSVAFSKGAPELDLVSSLPRFFQEIVRNCSGQAGRVQWSAAQLADWLRSQQLALSPMPAGSMRMRESGTRRSKPTNYVIGGALALVVLGTVGAYVTHRTTEPPVATAPAPATKPVDQIPAPAPPIPKQAVSKQSYKPEAAKSVPVEPVRREPVREVASTGRGDVIRQVLPEITDKARQTIHGTVVLAVHLTINQAGEVTDATLRPTNSRYLGKLALDAARKWEFAAGGPQERTLRFEITRDDTKVSQAK
jgi:TonB family protein